MNDSISVIIPTFNRAALVQQAVESVLQQRGNFQFEIIVIDDGSTPETARGLERFGDSIRYVRQKNSGLNPARNHGLRLATGAYIALLDDDDVWLPFKTELLMAAIRCFPQAGFVHSNFTIWQPQNDARRTDGLHSWFPEPFSWDQIYRDHVSIEIADEEAFGLDQSSFDAYYGDLYYWSLFSPMVLPSTALIRRSALTKECRFPEVDSVGDWEFFARLSHRCGSAFIPVDTTLNRSHEDAVRLTRVDPSLRLRRRIGLIRRLWRRDPAFMRAHGLDVDRVEAECLRGLARLCISTNHNSEAREALRELRVLTRLRTVGDALLWGLARLPFASAVVGIVRLIRTPRRSNAGVAR